MRSFAVIAGFAAVALAAPQYEAYPAESSAPAYEATTPAAYPAYPVETPAVSSAAYPAESSAAEYPAESSAAEYPVESSAVEYPVASSEVPVYTTTEVISATSYVCPEPTTITYGPSTYIITSSTVLSIPEYTATYVPMPSSEASMVYPTATPEVPAPSASKPAGEAPYPSVPAGTGAPYPSVPAGTGAPYPSAPAGTAAPSGTMPASPEFTGAAGKATVGFMAIVGAVAAFL